MESLWRNDDAERAIARYAQQGVNEDLALRVYTTRLLGREPRLVLHGGGNTSVKTQMTDVTGDVVDVLCVKGSGWDMAQIEPAGLPAVQLEPLRALESLDALSDEDMVNLQRRNLLDSAAPNPSIETLLHAFLAHKFVDHTHANAVLALTDQPGGESLCHDLYGDRVSVVPYVMPGFSMAKEAAAIAGKQPDIEGLVLVKHGIFSFGDTAEEAYQRMIALVSLAEQHLTNCGSNPFVQVKLPEALAGPGEIAPILRGLLSVERDEPEAHWDRFVLTYRESDAIRSYVGGADVARYSQCGTVTPDHVIRTKRGPLILPPPVSADLAGFAEAAREAIEVYKADYHEYFERNNRRLGGIKKELDPSPRVILVPGLGLFAAGNGAKAAAITADLAEATVEVVTLAESFGQFESLSEADLFDVEYWSLEQAKLSKGAEKPLARHVVAVTGGAGAIGAATGGAFRAQGAEVILLDRDPEALEAQASRLGALPVVCDVTADSSVAEAFDRICVAFGGLDILVSNAGAAWQGRIGEVDDSVLRKSFELNFFAHQRVAKAAVKIMLQQGTGGSLLFNASKQAINPGPKLGPYGLAKAATLALARQYAVDYGSDDIRSNAVNADRIRSGLLTDEMVSDRAKARGVSEDTYMRGNLLGREVRAEDVAKAFVDLALSPKTTGGILTVDGGNIAAALR